MWLVKRKQGILSRADKQKPDNQWQKSVWQVRTVFMPFRVHPTKFFRTSPGCASPVHHHQHHRHLDQHTHHRGRCCTGFKTEQAADNGDRPVTQFRPIIDNRRPPPLESRHLRNRSNTTTPQSTVRTPQEISTEGWRKHTNPPLDPAIITELRERPGLL